LRKRRKKHKVKNHNIKSDLKFTNFITFIHFLLNMSFDLETDKRSHIFESSEAKRPRGQAVETTVEAAAEAAVEVTVETCKANLEWHRRREEILLEDVKLGQAKLDDKLGRIATLRLELDQAYAAQEINTADIQRVAERMAEECLALARVTMSVGNDMWKAKEAKELVVEAASAGIEQVLLRLRLLKKN
jgi:hypothetical protein